MSRRRKQRIADHQKAAATMRNNPGQWIHVNDYRNRQSADNTASYIRHGTNHSPHCKNPYQPAGAYETHTELIDDFTRLHARYTKQATP